VEPEQGVEKSGLARSVRPQQADAAAGEGSAQPFEDRAYPKMDLQALELDDWIVRHGRFLQSLEPP
jgi:hypothetical protein